MSLAALALHRPLYDEAGQLHDFALDYFNPAAQRLTGLPERPQDTARSRFPGIFTNGVFEFYRRVVETGEAGHFDFHYQTDGFDNYFYVAACRSGGALVVSFTNTGSGERSPVEVALRTSQTRERAARAEVEQLNEELAARVQERTRQLAAAELQRGELLAVFEQAPAAIAIFDGPTHVIRLANPAHLALWDKTAAQVLGRPLFEALPEAQGVGYEELLAGVLRTGEPYVAQELSVSLTRHGQRAPVYFDFVYQPWRDAQGEVTGVLVVATETTPQVLARQQAEALQAEVLAAAQRQAAERETLYQVFEQTPASIGILRGPTHRYEYVNPAFQALFAGRQLVGLPIAEAQPEAPAQGFVALLDRVYQTGETFRGPELPLVLPAADGQAEQTFYFNFTYQAYRENGVIVGVAAFAYDVTEQVLARRQQQESEQWVRAVVANAPFLLGLYTGPEFRIELANQAMVAAIGKGPDIFGRRYADVLPELENQAVFGQLQQAYASGEPLHLRNQPLEVVMDGTAQTFFYNYSLVPLRDAQGQLYGLLNTAVDVTDLTLANQRLAAYAAELEASEARFRTVADATPNMVWNLNPDGGVRYANKYCLDFLGITLDEFVANSWMPYLLPEDVALTQQVLGQAMAGHTLFRMETRLRRHDGQYRWMLTQGSPSYFPSGELYGYVGSAIDITDLKQTNEQLRRTNADLDTFVYTASHDLKAPITNIEGLLLALEHELPPAARVDDVPLMLHMMQDAVERFKRTIDHLTDVASLQKEHGQPQEQVALAPVVAAVQLDLAPLMQETQARLTVDVPAGTTLNFSEKNLRSVVYNLLSNALKYRHPDRVPEVRLRCRPLDGHQVLEVQDNGLGLDLTQGSDRLFVLFQRLHTHVEGTGIGLYMVKKMIENAGGRITVQSELGKGSTFTVYVPR